MRCKSLGLAVVLIFLVIGPALADNFAEPLGLSTGLVGGYGDLGIVVGFDTDFSSDRNLKNTVEDTELSFYGVKVGVALRDRALLYLLVGQGSAKMSYRAAGDRVQTETDKDFFWGIGGSVLLAQKEFDTGDKLLVGVDGWYRTASLDNDATKINGVAITPASYDVTYEEYQLGIGISYKLEFFVPYAGLKFSNVQGDADFDAGGTNYRFDLEADGNIGVFGGASLMFGGIGSVTFETRLGDEVSYSIYGVIRF